MRALRDLHAELELQFAKLQKNTLLAVDNSDVNATQSALVRENRALRQRNDAFLRWESRLNELLERQEDDKEACDMRAPELNSCDANALYKPFGLAMKQPMTIDECHAIARKSYVEIEAFTECEDYESTGVVVFGWTDRRRLDEDLLKFSLQKTFVHHSVYDLVSRTWAMVRNVASFEKLYSANMHMRCEMVQEIDANNVVFFQEYDVAMGNVLTVVRSLVLATRFETYNGYIILFYSINPKRLEHWPEDRKAAQGVTIRYQWQQYYGWTRSETAGLHGECSKCSYAGAVPTEAAGVGFWMVEVLLQVLRWENLVIGPLITITNDDVGLACALDSWEGEATLTQWTVPDRLGAM